MNVRHLLHTPKHQLIILILLAFGLNMNTLFNQYAVDDAIVLTNNKFVEKGIKGIPEIVTTDYFKGLGTLRGNELSGGRYRPFALIIFALEYQFFGANPMISHLINILLFIVLIVLLYQLLYAHVFKELNKYLAFITCLLFVVHPIHTEVIANVKSRDEIIAFILLIISLTSLIIYTETKSTGKLISGVVCFFLALLTKESSVTYIFIFPLVLFFFYRQTFKKAMFYSLPLIIVFVGYMALRYFIIGFNSSTTNLILNTPYLFATSSQAFATKVFILFKYVCLLILPHPLVSDYSFNQIPYIDINSIQFIFSSLFLISLIVLAFLKFKRKSLISFCIIFFFINIFLVSNFIVNIGAPLAERLLFQPSLAYCILIGALYLKIKNNYKRFANVALLVILLLFSIKTISRNTDWKNNDTLYFADVITSSNSLRTNMYAAESYLNKANTVTDTNLKLDYFNKSIHYGEQAVKIYQKDAFVFMNLGSAYFGIGSYFKSADLWQQAYKLEPTEPEAKKAIDFISSFLFKQGNEYFENGKIIDAIRCYKKSTDLNPDNVEAWYNLGGNYYIAKDTVNADLAWNKVKQLAHEHRFNKMDFIN